MGTGRLPCTITTHDANVVFTENESSEMSNRSSNALIPRRPQALCLQVGRLAEYRFLGFVSSLEPCVSNSSKRETRTVLSLAPLAGSAHSNSALIAFDEPPLSLLDLQALLLASSQVE